MIASSMNTSSLDAGFSNIREKCFAQMEQVFVDKEIACKGCDQQELIFQPGRG